MSVRKGLGELLVRENLINMTQLDEARREQKVSGGKLTSALVRLGLVRESELVDFLGKQFSLPTIDLFNFEIDPEAVKLVPKQFCEKHSIMPVSKAGKNLVVAFADPSNVFVKDDLALLTRHKIDVVIASEGAINTSIEKHYGSTSARLENVMSEIEETEDVVGGGQAQAQVEVVDQEVGRDEAPIVKFVNLMLAEAIKIKASDIHVEPYEKRFRIRFRVDGGLVEKTQPPPGAAAAIVSRLKILSKMDIGEKRRPQDGRLKVRLKNGREIDFRVNCLPTLFGEKIVLRLLDKSNLQVDMTKLGMEEEELALLKETLNRPQGLLLITGPTGSGKTTTIYSGLAELNKPDVNISTAEDPVEFNLDGINQVQVNSQIGFTFAEALRAFLRQDPEVIMVGEIRDLETAEVAFKAASTGHLVVSTLHTNDAASTITRLVDMGVPPYMVAEATSLCVAQRLMRKNCPNCSEEHRVPPDVLLNLGVPEADLGLYTGLRKGEGCEVCGGSGLKGRMAIFEVMRITAAVKDAIFKSASPLELKRHAIAHDKMRTLRGAALLKLRAGLTTIEEVLNSSVRDDV
ncbi:MAG: type IV-A pilus assembly ATPase PilB [Bdellovibrionales bacterium]